MVNWKTLRQDRLAVLLASFILWQAANQAHAQQWVRTLDGGTRGDDEALAVIPTSDDAMVVTGYIDLGTHQCGALVKYSASGEREWLTTYDPYPGHTSRISHVVTAASGELFAAAVCKDSSDIQTAAVLKLSADGSLLREFRYSHPDHLLDSPSALVPDGLGNIVVVCRSKTNATDYDILVLKCDTACQPMWMTRYDLSGGLNRPSSAAIDTTGSIYVVGYGIIDSSSATVGTVLKLTPDGDTSWTWVGSTPAEVTEFKSVAASDSCIYVIGYRSFGRARALTTRFTDGGDTVWTRERVLGVPIAAVAVDNFGVIHTDMADDSATSMDWRTFAYSCDGTLRWVSRYDGPGHRYDSPADIAVDPTNDAVYVAGYAHGDGTGWDCTTLSYDFEGNLNWVGSYAGDGGSGDDVCTAICIDSEGNIIVAGYTSLEGTGKDMLLIKYPPSGPGIGELAARKTHPSYPSIRVSPSIARGVCSVAIQNAPESTELRVHDACGRLVRRIPILLSPSQPTHVEWHLDDTRGGPVPNGIYFVTVDEPSCRTGTKVVVQR